MKLYTEEEIKRTFGFGMNEIMFDGFLRAMTHIELPSDDEIEREARDENIYNNLQFRKGAKWVINKIKGGNK